jgi:hypothetical protein
MAIRAGISNTASSVLFALAAYPLWYELVKRDQRARMTRWRGHGRGKARSRPIRSSSTAS